MKRAVDRCQAAPSDEIAELPVTAPNREVGEGASSVTGGLEVVRLSPEGASSVEEETRWVVRVSGDGAGEIVATRPEPESLGPDPTSGVRLTNDSSSSPTLPSNKAGRTSSPVSSAPSQAPR